MHPETPRSRAPNGLFTDDSSSPPTDARRSVNGRDPYRDTRDSLLAHRNALAKELTTIDARLDDLDGERAATLPPSSPNRSIGLSELGAIFLPRRAMGVVMAGVLAGVGVSSLLAYELGVCWTIPGPADRVVVDGARRVRPEAQDESRAEHALRRRKEGEALLMSSLFTSSRHAAVETSRPGEGAGGDRHITRLGTATWQVDESVLSAAEPLYTSLRMLPHLSPDGLVDGIRLSGIHPQGIHAQLGLQNGDIVLRANGIEVTGADGVFGALESARRTHYLALEIRRAGELLTLHYLIAAR